jgi:transcription initiation factor TFIIH subunit 1
MWNSGEDVVLEAPAKLRKKEGMLFLTNQSLVWRSNDVNNIQEESIPFSQIKSQFINQPSQSGKVMLKIVLNENNLESLFIFSSIEEQAIKQRDSFKDHLAKILGKLKLQSSSLTTPESPSVSRIIEPSSSTTQIPNITIRKEPLINKEELRLRASLLSKNRDLLKLHKELVLTGHVTEEEFWDSRKHLLLTQEVLAKQKKGLSSSLLADIKPTTDTTSSDIKYTLTPAIIHSIFLQYPQVHNIYKENVPDKVRERNYTFDQYSFPNFPHSYRRRNSGQSIFNQNFSIVIVCNQRI